MDIRIHKTISLPSADRDLLIQKKVMYRQFHFMKTVNAISLKLGAKKKQESGEIGTFFYPEGGRISQTTIPLSSREPMYEVYWNEDKIIPTMLDLTSITVLNDPFGLNSGLFARYAQKPKFIDSFNFSALYSYLKNCDGFCNPEYLEVIKQYLEEFSIGEEEESVSMDDFYRYYKNGDDVFRLQRKIALNNEKILSLKH